MRVGRHTNADGGVRVLRGEPDGEVRKSSQRVRGVVGMCTPLWRTPCVPSVHGRTGLSHGSAAGLRRTLT